MKNVLFIFFLLFTLTIKAQVGINTTDPKAQLDIEAGTTPSEMDGLLIPRLDEYPTGVGADQDGMLVFITGDGVPSKGFYYYSQGIGWVAIQNTTGTSNTLNEAYDEGGAGAGRTITADAGAVTITGEDGFVVTGTFGSGNTIDTEVSGAGTRLFFNPNKAAFRAGSISGTQWSNANTGEYSTAVGLDNIASGNGSFSAGLANTASGEYATALGTENIASSNESMAIGYQNNATGLRSFVFGSESTASGDYSHAGGNDAQATATNAIALGNGTRALGIDAVALGKTSEAQQNLSTAIAGGTSLAVQSTSMGEGTVASSFGEISIGLFNTGYVPNSQIAFDGEDRLFNVGNGTTNGNRSDAFTILKNGNIGFGQSNPQNPLSVGKSTVWDLSHQNTGQDGIYIIGGDDNSGLNSIGGSIGFGPSNPTRKAQRKSAIAAIQTGGDIDHLGLAFFVHGNAVNQSPMEEGMRLTHNNRLGINNTDPSANLDVIGTFQYEDGNEANGYVLSSDANGNASWTDPATLITGDNDWEVVGADIERQSGDVYIGNDAATNNKLVVSGIIEDWDDTSYVLDPNSASKMNEIEYDAGAATTPSINFEGSPTTGLFSPVANNMSITTNGTERFRFTDKSQIEFPNGGTSVFIGNNAGDNDDLTNNRNVFIGENAGRNNTSGSGNVFTGYFSGVNNETGSNNIALGNLSLRDNESGFNNIAIGWQNNVRGTGSNNITMGDNTAVRLGTGSRNVMIGPSAGNRDHLTSSNNVYIGSFAGGGNTNNNMPPYYEKSGNVFLGNEAGRYQTASNTLIIENTDADANNALIYGEFGTDNTTTGNVLRTNGELQIGNPTGTGYALPTNQGTANQVLTSNGDGTTQWASPSFTEVDGDVTNEIQDLSMSDFDMDISGGGTSASMLAYVNPNYPDGFMGLEGITEIPDVTGYTVPAGKNLYITSVYSQNSTYTLTINNILVYEGQGNFRTSTIQTQPIIASAGQVVRSNNSLVTINGFLADAKVSPITRRSNATYIVPTNMVLVITSLINSYGTDTQVFINNRRLYLGDGNGSDAGVNSFFSPIFADSGDFVLTSGSTLNGYLITK